MIVWVDGDVLSIVTMKVSKIMVFRAFYMTRHSNWSSCSQSQRKNLPFDDAWTTRLERCLLVPSSPWALPNLSQGKKSCISGREKKPLLMLTGEITISVLTSGCFSCPHSSHYTIFSLWVNVFLKKHNFSCSPHGRIQSDHDVATTTPVSPICKWPVWLDPQTDS